jgi:hypothetical protein
MVRGLFGRTAAAGDRLDKPPPAVHASLYPVDRSESPPEVLDDVVRNGKSGDACCGDEAAPRR